MAKLRDVGAVTQPKRKRRTQWELFLARHKPKLNHLNSGAPMDGFMFETYGDELAFVRSQEFHHVFTLVEGDTTPNTYACSGFHRVNRMGFFVVEVPWTSENEHVVYKT